MAQPIQIDKHKFIVPDSGDPCDVWRIYFSQLKKALGTDNARYLWLVTWTKNGSTTCTTNADFNGWLKKNQIDVSTAGSRMVADASEIGSNLFGLGKGITKVLSIGVPVILIGVLVLIITMLIKVGKDAKPSDLAMLHPTGRAFKLLKK